MRNLQAVANGRWFDPAVTGYRITYHREADNRCPACGKSHWLVGRMSAQCAFCDTMVPFAENGSLSGRAAAFA